MTRSYLLERLNNATVWLRAIKTFWPNPGEGELVTEYLDEVLGVAIVLEAVESFDLDDEEFDLVLDELEESVGQVMTETMLWIEARNK